MAWLFSFNVTSAAFINPAAIARVLWPGEFLQVGV
jgi:hypothetical protein